MLGVLMPTLLAGGLWLEAPAAPQGEDEGTQLLVSRVLPILRDRCFECHGPSARRAKGGLRIGGLQDLLAGGDSGPAVIPGDAEASLLLAALRYEDLLEMPPDAPLEADEIEAFERWVNLGAPWPEEIAAEEQPPIDPEDLAFFERRIRPALAEHCFACHGPRVETPQGELRMAGRRSLLIGGARGPALVPGDPDASLLIQAVRRHDDAPVAMPPTGPVPESVLADLEHWVTLGAPWPDEADALPVHEGGIDLEEGRRWWSFRPVERPAVPAVQRAEWVASPIDAFLLARQEEAGVAPNPPATRRELIRRAYHDLHGLPPTLEEIAAFEADDSPQAWERLVDRLLASPRYGERWARHWLDLVRFAQTNGYERDAEKPFAWRYRDWVIQALNDDLPYDRFLKLQLAGDELAGPEEGPEALIATGFYRIGAWDDEPDDAETAVYDELDDVLRTITEGMLGMTLACARCHDHKFDPFPQEDYYSFLAYLRGVRPYEDVSFHEDSAMLRLIDATPEAAGALEEERQETIAQAQAEFDALLELGRRRAIEHRLGELPEEVRQAWETPEDQRSEEQRERVASDGRLHPSSAEIRRRLTQAEKKAANQLRMRIEAYEVSFAGAAPWALVVRERGPSAPDTHLLVRGKASAPGDVVPLRFPQVLAEGAAPKPKPRGKSSGRRAELAQWIADGDHPLTARVIVNRVWQFHFGRGLVPTANDFGRSGLPPSHPELLDWLASTFVEEDAWSLKALHRRILLSNAYRMSSRTDASPGALERDEANEFFWRQSMRRVEAEVLRDSLLAASGELSLEAGGRGFFPRLSREALAGSSRPGEGWEVSTPEQRHRRSIYAFIKRSQSVPLMELFDGPTPSLPVGRRSTTTLATQALTLLNGEFAGERAHALAQAVAEEAGSEPAARVQRAFERVLARRPTARETELSLAFLEQQSAGFAQHDRPLILRSRVPRRLDADFLQALGGEDLVFGPRLGWVYAKGLWANPYNATLGADPERGPVAYRNGLAFRDGRVSARLRMTPGTEAAGLLLRARPAGAEVQGIEVRFEPEAGQVRILAHGAENTRVGGTFPAALETGRWHGVVVTLAERRLSVELDGQALGRLNKLPQPAEGFFGLRLVGEELAVDDLTLRVQGQTHRLTADPPGPPDLRALEALCLTLFNLNEFVYVD